jgi:diguanylate cyclase (GGDEF)-like protein
MWKQHEFGSRSEAGHRAPTGESPVRSATMTATGPRPAPTPVPGAPGAAQAKGGPATAAAAGRGEIVAMARLAWALGRSLTLLRHTYASLGQSVTDIAELEGLLAQARLPDEYVEVTRRMALLAAPPAGAAGQTGGALLATFRRALATVARALVAENVAHELDALSKRYDVEGDEDPAPLLTALGHLTDMIARSRESSDVLNEALTGVQVGIRKIADEEEKAQGRLRESRARIEQTSSATELTELRTALLAETKRIEEVMSERRAHLEQLEKQSRSAGRRAARLTAALADATTAAATDVLTGLGNRRALDHAVEATPPHGERGILMIDIDHFKHVNDTYGHGVGDRVLAHVAETLQLELRGEDQGFRTGGEEFVAILHACDRSGALRTAERVRARIESSPSHILGRSLSVTVSIGVSTWVGGSSFQDAVERADSALYDAKRGGRNRCLAESIAPKPMGGPRGH